MMPDTAFRSVDFPEPDDPIMDTISPSETERFTPFRTSRRVYCVVYDFLIFFNSIIWVRIIGYDFLVKGKPLHDFNQTSIGNTRFNKPLYRFIR